MANSCGPDAYPQSIQSLEIIFGKHPGWLHITCDTSATHVRSALAPGNMAEPMLWHLMFSERTTSYTVIYEFKFTLRNGVEE